MQLISWAFLLVFVFSLVGAAYLYLLCFASLLPFSVSEENKKLCFAVAIPAHNEAEVIARTVATIYAADHPRQILDIYVAADYCSDDTACQARQAGAFVLERNQGPRTGKGAALSWLFQHILSSGKPYDAIVVFDADTQVHPAFFQVMSRRLAGGALVAQGNHIIRNPDAGWFPALTWAMFLIDNRCQNMGRSKLGLSAKNMGDSICFQTEVIRRFGWGEGLTEDYAFRQRLLLEGIQIEYEPEAIGYGDAAANWQIARAQRARWLRGAYQASRKLGWEMLWHGIIRRKWMLLDGAFQAFMPSYSTLTLIAAGMLATAWLLRNFIWFWLPTAWFVIFIVLFLYPLLALAFDRAPLRAFLVILTGPIYICWRSFLSIRSRFFQKQDQWIRTPR